MSRALKRPMSEDDEVWFLDESWFRLGPDGEAVVGVILPRITGTAIDAIRLPREGDQMWQGLPFAAITVADRPPRLLHAPFSGLITEVNATLVDHPSTVFDDPCGEGWMARVRPHRLASEFAVCLRRQVILVTMALREGLSRGDLLRSQGCQVAMVTARSRLVELLSGPTNPCAAQRDGVQTAFIVDAAGFGPEGPAIVGEINARAPNARVIVAADDDGRWEAAYRTYHVFYYAVRPFADLEIVDILDAAFRKNPSAETAGSTLTPLSDRPYLLRVTSTAGEAVTLLTAFEPLGEAKHLTGLVHSLLAQEGFHAELVATTTCDLNAAARTETSRGRRVILLEPRDTGRPPYSLTCDPPPQCSATPRAPQPKLATLLVQPPAAGENRFCDARTVQALARHVVRVIAEASG